MTVCPGMMLRMLSHTYTSPSPHTTVGNPGVGGDFVADITYTFEVGSTRSCQELFIFDDPLFELTEDFSIEVRGILDPDGVEVPAIAGITVDPSETEVFILDNDG